jgi:hypothetical protein
VATAALFFSTQRDVPEGESDPALDGGLAAGVMRCWCQPDTLTCAGVHPAYTLQLTINLVALIVAFVAAITNGETPLNVLQLLWVNLIMDSLAALGEWCRACVGAVGRRQPQPPVCSAVRLHSLGTSWIRQHLALRALVPSAGALLPPASG